MTTTPDVEADLIARLAARAPSVIFVTGASRNTWAGPERPTVGVVPRRAVFVARAGEFVNIYGGGQYRYFTIDVVVRSLLDDYAGGELLSRQVYDALHLSGAFTGTTGQAYDDIRVEQPQYDGQEDNGPHFWSMTVQLWADV